MNTRRETIKEALQLDVSTWREKKTVNYALELTVNTRGQNRKGN